MKRRASCVALALGGTCLSAALAWACNDPVHDARVSALGDEKPGVPAGPNHRPGQPCLTCHGGDGPSKVELSVAGTIFQTAAADSPPLAGATVTIFDATQLADAGDGISRPPQVVGTNAAGNFYIPRSSWSPFFPLHDISVSFAGGAPTMMHTNVGRDGSCGTCHFDPKGADSHGHVYLVLEAADFPGAMP
jgi:hypothetical protein